MNADTSPVITGESDVAVLLGWDPSKARLYLKRAFEGSRIRRLERGLYAPLTTVTSETTETFQSEMNRVVTEDTQVTRLHDAKRSLHEGSSNCFISVMISPHLNCFAHVVSTPNLVE